MTDNPSPSCGTSGTTCEDPVTQACVHIDAAARQLETAAGGDVFSPLLGLAGQLALIRGGIDPANRAAVDPNDRLRPVAHVDLALSMLDGVKPSAGPADLLVWTLHLADLRNTLLANGAGQP
jgi:hypothetical protein